MKSKTSLYNFGLARSIIKRSWPLWLAYFVTVFSALPLVMVSYNASYLRQEGYFHRFFLNGAVYESVEAMTIISFLYAPVAAMVLFGFLYNNRSCSMMASLPIKRETMFSTIFITGLVPMLISDLAAMLCAYLLFGSSANLGSGVLAEWLLAAVMGNIAFYGFVVFCAMLTSSLFVLPAVYVVLNCTAAVVVLTVNYLLGEIVYGYTYGDNNFLMYLSPIVACVANVRSYIIYAYAGATPDNMEHALKGLGLLCAYAVSGLILSALAMLMFKKRRMETAGDTVAIQILKPMFKYCLSLGTALVLAAVGFELIFNNIFAGLPATAVICLLMLLGAFIGYFVAEMLIQKTFMVFRSGWRGMGICAAAVIAFCLIGETGMLGYEKRVPDTEKIESVELHIGYSYDMLPVFTEAEDIAMVTELHRTLLEEKNYLENNSQLCSMAVFTYTLKDGSKVDRLYRYPLTAAQAQQSAGVCLMNEILNTDSALRYRFPEFPNLTEDNVDGFEISYTDSEGQYHDVRVTMADAIAFYNEAVRPDGLEGKIGRNYAYGGENSGENYTTVWVYICFKVPADDEAAVPFDYWSRAFTLTFEAERTMNWLLENCDVEMIPAENDENGFEYGYYNFPGSAVG